MENPAILGLRFGPQQHVHTHRESWGICRTRAQSLGGARVRWGRHIGTPGKNSAHFRSHQKQTRTQEPQTGESGTSDSFWLPHLTVVTRGWKFRLHGGILCWSGPGLLGRRLNEHNGKWRILSQDTLILPTPSAVSLVQREPSKTS